MMDSEVSSFFDSDSKLERLWSNNVSELSFNPDEVIISGELSKYSQSDKKFKLRYFVLTKDRLLCFQGSTDKDPQGYAEMIWCKTFKINKEDQKPLQYGIRFVRNQKYSDLWMESEETQKDWMAKLSKITIQSEFHHKYSATKLIGKGSFARVYLVSDNHTHEKLAVKAFSKENLLSQPKGRASLINEISIMRQLTHHNIMRLEEVHESANSIYLVVELLEGGELFNQISSQPSMTIPQLAKVLRDILKALAYMDSRGIMHRDLKPENIILKKKMCHLENNDLKLVDMGLATKYNLSDYLFRRCGTPGFVAPEVLNVPKGSPVMYNAKCDVFSAGIILYMLIIGRGPFDAKSFSSILAKNKEADVDFSHKNLSRASPECFDLLKKMLNTNPDERLSAAECLAHHFLSEPEDVYMSLPSVEEGIGVKIKEFQCKYKSEFKSLKKKQQLIPPTIGFSMEMREGGSINGRTDSIKDSVDFDPSHSNVGSLAYVNSQKPSLVSKNQKRESIYKAALLSQLKSSNFEELAKMSHSQSQSSADSQSEGTYSEDEEIPEEFPKKSRFGPKN